MKTEQMLFKKPTSDLEISNNGGDEGGTQLRLLLPKPSRTTLPSDEPREIGDSQVIPQSHEELVSALQKQRKPRYVFAFFRDWAWEAAGIFMSGIIIIAIAVILRRYNGRKQPDWKHISLNSLISWLSTLAKACVLFSASQAIGQLKWVWFARKSRPLSDLDTFDSASRGVTGSAALLWLVKGQNLAMLGSLATILAVGFDPFVQNLVHYTPHSIEDPSEVSLLASTSFYNTVGPLLGGNTFYVDPILKANVYSALFNVDPSQPWAFPQYTCPTGNCTWDAMTSVEIRALCSNVTLDLKPNCNYVKDYSTNNCTLSLDSGIALWYLPSGGAARLMVINTVSENSDSVYKNSSFPVIQYILAIGSNDDPTKGGGVSTEVGNNTRFVATECVLQPLVRSFQASVIMGVYQETQLAEWTVMNTTVSTKLNHRIAFTPSWNESYGMQEGQLYGIGYEAWSSITLFLEELFGGYVAAASDSFSFQRSGRVGLYATIDALAAIFYNNFTDTNCQDNDQLTCALSYVAAAMSKTIRDSAITDNVNFQLRDGSVANTTAGRTRTIASYVVIRWGWLVLPIVVWVLGTLSCIGSAWSTYEAQIQTWMNSTLPLAFSHLVGSESSHVVETGVSSGQGPDSSDADRYYSFLCYDKSLEGNVQRAKQTQVKLEGRQSAG
ncbi:hypothetical protein BBP40_010134 [Aspergillus hancockii]|nr:hypothetical protein BBP40_010134 [Aspergillus hancockii]